MKKHPPRCFSYRCNCAKLDGVLGMLKLMLLILRLLELAHQLLSQF